MKKLLLGAAVIASMTATNANATQETFPYWYLGLSGGGTEQSDSSVSHGNQDINWDTGVIGSVELGYQHPSLVGFRPEIEYSYRHQDISNGNDIMVNVVAANLYYDFYNSSVVTPYIGGGLGYGHFNIDGSPSVHGSDSKAIYQVMAGIGYEPTTIHNVGFTLGYRYMAPFSDPDANGNTSYEYDNHSVEVGAKFHF